MRRLHGLLHFAYFLLIVIALPLSLLIAVLPIWTVTIYEKKFPNGVRFEVVAKPTEWGAPCDYTVMAYCYLNDAEVCSDGLSACNRHHLKTMQYSSVAFLDRYYCLVDGHDQHHLILICDREARFFYPSEGSRRKRAELRKLLEEIRSASNDPEYRFGFDLDKLDK